MTNLTGIVGKLKQRDVMPYGAHCQLSWKFSSICVFQKLDIHLSMKYAMQSFVIYSWLHASFGKVGNLSNPRHNKRENKVTNMMITTIRCKYTFMRYRHWQFQLSIARNTLVGSYFQTWTEYGNKNKIKIRKIKVSLVQLWHHNYL